MKEQSATGRKIETGVNWQDTIRKFLQEAVNKELFDAVLLPMQVPAKDSYAWILIKDPGLLEKSIPLAPVMPVNAANALKRFTRKGEGKYKIAALMRPCEVRACVELVKLNQINRDKLIIISYDCPGAIPLSDYIADPEASEKEFIRIMEEADFCAESVKPICSICEDFTAGAGDLHLVLQKKQAAIIATSEAGKEILSDLQLAEQINPEEWQSRNKAVKAKRKDKKEDRFKQIRQNVEGLDNLLTTFSECIGCHNCQSVCPICYCRQCYFESAAAQPNSDVIMMRSQQRGGLSFPLDKLMFHTGRMSHMSLSCVSCGLCSDACPVDIPVAEIFSYVGSQTQKTFNYKAGEHQGDCLPLKEYKTEELGELKKLVNSAETGVENNE